MWSEFSNAYVVGNTRKTFSYMDALTIDYVFQSVILASLKSSDNCGLRAAYDQILDDLDHDKDLAFAHIQTICARQFRRRKERRIHLTAMTARAPRRAHRRSNTRAAQEYFPSSVPSDTDTDDDYAAADSSECDDSLLSLWGAYRACFSPLYSSSGFQKVEDTSPLSPSLRY